MTRPWSWCVATLVVAQAACDDSQQKAFEACPAEACSGHGLCLHTLDGQPRCDCEPGYLPVGLECRADCLAVDCSDRGGCIVLEGRPACVCEQGYQAVGLTCRPAPEDCFNVACSNHGGCIEEAGEPACICETGYVPFGLNCVPAICKNVSCSGHGACVMRDGAPTCDCDPSYVPVGLGCLPSDCALSDCSGHGACLGDPGAASCACDLGHVAVRLECRPSACELEDCSGHGACLEGAGEPTCRCDPGYAAVGLACRPRCAELNCGEHGACVQVGGEPTCWCDPGYVVAGTTCQVGGTPGGDGGANGGPDAEVDGGLDGGTDGGPEAGADGGAEGDAGPGDGAPSDGAEGGPEAGLPLPPEWVLITGGTFLMGSPASETGHQDTEEPQHQVTLTGDFWLMVTEVTQEQFQWLLGYNPSHFGPHNPGPNCGPRCPVEQVSWHEMAALANAWSRAEGYGECYNCSGTGPGVSCSASTTYGTPYACPGFRLPTEAEWEYAARAEDDRATYNGDFSQRYCERDDVLEPIAWYCANARYVVHQVGLKEANPWGLYDMLGNVGEWCHDFFGAYPVGPETNPLGPATGRGRVARGASWFAMAAEVRAAGRVDTARLASDATIGGRLARSDL